MTVPFPMSDRFFDLVLHVAIPPNNSVFACQTFGKEWKNGKKNKHIRNRIHNKNW